MVSFTMGGSYVFQAEATVFFDLQSKCTQACRLPCDQGFPPSPWGLWEGPRSCGLCFEECSTVCPSRECGGDDPSLCTIQSAYFLTNTTCTFPADFARQSVSILFGGLMYNSRRGRSQVMQEFMRGVRRPAAAPLRIFWWSLPARCSYRGSSIVRHIRATAHVIWDRQTAC
jgi:hypothetical protein